MRVFKSIENLPEIKSPVVTIGTFDGLHLGHQKIIDRINSIAHTIGGESVVITFSPHPRLVLFPDDNDLKLLNTLDEKIERFRDYGVDNLIIYPFTKKFSRLTSVQFVRDILVNKVRLKKLVIGYDHHFGRNREGSFEKLQELAPLYNFEVEEIPVLDVQEVSVSSTKIRKALNAGDIATAKKYLGYPYSIKGKVVKGSQIGRTIGYPTANIQLKGQHKLVPKDGSYAVYVYHNSVQLKGMLNIGIRPTVDGIKRVIEVNIFDFDENIYDSEITVEFVQKIREEQKFEELNLLKMQLANDKIKSLRIL